MSWRQPAANEAAANSATNSTSFGSTVRFLWMMSFSSSIGTGDASTLVKPCAIVLRAASTSAWPVESAITP